MISSQQKSSKKTVAEFLEGNGERIESADPNPVKTSPVSKQASSPLISPKSDAKGGIDFRALPIVTQAISNLSLNTSHISLSGLGRINLDQELSEIQRLLEQELRLPQKELRSMFKCHILKAIQICRN